MASKTAAANLVRTTGLTSGQAACTDSDAARKGDRALIKRRECLSFSAGFNVLTLRNKNPNPQLSPSKGGVRRRGSYRVIAFQKKKPSYGLFNTQTSVLVKTSGGTEQSECRMTSIYLLLLLLLAAAGCCGSSRPERDRRS